MVLMLKYRLTRVDWFLIGLLLLLTIVYFARFLLPPFPMIMPTSGLGTDLDREIWTLSHFIRDTLNTTGQIPQWRSYVLSGIPLFGNLQNPIPYPIHWLMFIQAIPLPLALTLDMVIHVWLAGFGMYVVLRRLGGLRPEASFIGALIYGFAPRLFIHMSGGHWWLIPILTMIPWAYFFFHAAWITRRTSYMLLLGIVFAAVLIGNTQYFVYHGFMLLLSSAGYFWIERKTPGRWLWKMIRIWGITGVVALGLSAVMFLPQFVYLPYTNRALLTYQESVATSLPLVMLIGIAAPTQLRYPEAFLYLGAGVIPLILAGAGRGWTGRDRLWGGGTLIALILSFGATAGLYTVLYYAVPVMPYFRTPERFYVYVPFGAAALAAFAWDRWVSGEAAKRWLRPVLIGAAVLFALLTIGGFILPELPFAFFPHGIAAAVIAVVLAFPAQRWSRIAAAVIIAAELLYTGSTFVTPIPEAELIAADDPLIVFLRENLSEDERVMAPYGGVSDMALLANGINTADGYNGAQLRTYTEYLNAAIGCDYQGYSVAAPAVRGSAAASTACPQAELDGKIDDEALRRLNVRYLILTMPLESRDAVFSDGERYVYDLGQGYGRAWGLRDFRYAEGCPLIQFDRAWAYGNDWDGDGGITQGIPSFNNPIPEILAHGRTLNGEWFEVNVPQWEALLFRSEVWSPGLYANVSMEDGRIVRVRVACTYGTLQAIWVPPGIHRVQFDYDVAQFPLLVTGITAAMVIGLLGFYTLRGTLRNSRERKQPTS